MYYVHVHVHCLPTASKLVTNNIFIFQDDYLFTRMHVEGKYVEVINDTNIFIANTNFRFLANAW